MNLSLAVNATFTKQSEVSSPTSVQTKDFSDLRVVSQDQLDASPNNSSSLSEEDQFEDAPEDATSSVSPLQALAMACAAENNAVVNRQEGATTAAFQISQNDVLCGRGGLTNHHPGNVFFRRLVRIKQESYLLATKREKAGVAREIVDLIRSLNPPGRFLKKAPKNPNEWIEIGDRKAREKTSQALREGAPELREDLQQQQLVAVEQPAVQGQRQDTVPPAQPPTTQPLPEQTQQTDALMSDEARGIMENIRQVNPPTRFLQPDPNSSRAWLDNDYKQAEDTDELRFCTMDSTPTTAMATGPPALLSNRARIVSDDSVEGYPQWRQTQSQQMQASSQQTSQQQPHVIERSASEFFAGTKRKSPTPCSMQEQMYDRNQQQVAKRGPRLKLLKSRVMEIM